MLSRWSFGRSKINLYLYSEVTTEINLTQWTDKYSTHIEVKEINKTDIDTVKRLFSPLKAMFVCFKLKQKAELNHSNEQI